MFLPYPSTRLGSQRLMGTWLTPDSSSKPSPTVGLLKCSWVYECLQEKNEASRSQGIPRLRIHKVATLQSYLSGKALLPPKFAF